MTFQIWGYAHLIGFKTWDSPPHPAFRYEDDEDVPRLPDSGDS